MRSQADKKLLLDEWDLDANDWNFRPRRPLNERDVVAWQTIKNSLPVKTGNNNPDRSTWILDSKGTYTTASTKKPSLKAQISPQ